MAAADTSTPLRRRLENGPERSAPGPMDAFRLATREFMAGERIDMQALAAELGVNRATLYRWVGGKELLLGELISALARTTFENAVRDTPGQGLDLVVGMLERSLRQIRTFAPMKAFLDRDPQYALRILTSSESVVHRRTVELNQRLLEEQVAAGRLKLPADAADLAYVIVRISESFLYSDVIIGREPDTDKAAEMVRLLLRE